MTSAKSILFPVSLTNIQENRGFIKRKYLLYTQHMH